MLIIAGALVGASGTILTKLMADAMNRSIPSIVIGGFGTADSDGSASTRGRDRCGSSSVDDAAIQLAYASRVAIVPGYGLAAAQAQHAVRSSRRCSSRAASTSATRSIPWRDGCRGT